MTALMNEWPTRVRTGVPPCSRMTSGTAFEQIRLCRMVAPGCGASMLGGHDGRGERARHQLALVVDQEDPVGVAVEGQADVGPGLEHPGLQIDQVLGLDRDRPDGSGRCRRARRRGSRARRAGRRTRPAPPGRPCRWPCRPRPCSGASWSRSTKRVHVGDEVGQRVAPARRCPPAADRREPVEGQSGGWRSRPVSSPTGRAPVRHSLMPLYAAGLCDAVSMAPGASSGRRRRRAGRWTPARGRPRRGPGW